MPSPLASAQHAIGIKVGRLNGIFRATVFVLSLIGAIPYRLNASGWLGPFFSIVRFDLGLQLPLSRVAAAFSAIAFSRPIEARVA